MKEFVPEMAKWFLALGMGLVGRLLYHTTLVQRGRRKFFSRALALELPIAVGMGCIAHGFCVPLPYVWPGMPADEICLEGALWPHSTHSFTDRWTSEYTTVSISTDHAYTGTRSLKVSRAVSTDYSRNDSLNLLIPTRGGNIMGEFRVLFPNDTVPYDLMKIYFREWWVTVIGQDAYGRPMYGPKLLFAGETDLDVPETGSMTWVQRGIGTLYADDTTDAAAEKAIYPPAWATHLLLMLDHQSVPALDYYIDGLWANEIG